MQPSADRIDDESKRCFDEVKKGRARKFVMIKDGVQIDRLYVFKKGSWDHYLRIAKQAGIRGEAYWGVVRGNGLDIRFELSREDGFNSPPGTDHRLKDFLREGGLKFEPKYAIVDVLAPIEETGDAGNKETGSDAAGEGAEEKFVRLLKAILPHVKRALATTTSVSDELRSRVREAQDLGRQREFESGLATLRVVGDLTKQALAEAESGPSRSQQWETILARLEPKFEQQTLAAAPNADKLRIIMDYAKDQAGRKQFVKALVGLKRLEPLLRETT